LVCVWGFLKQAPFLTSKVSQCDLCPQTQHACLSKQGLVSEAVLGDVLERHEGRKHTVNKGSAIREERAGDGNQRKDNRRR
jgi:hypothetical protein